MYREAENILYEIREDSFFCVLVGDSSNEKSTLWPTYPQGRWNKG